MDASELAPERGAELVGDQQRKKNDADCDSEILGDFDPEMSVDHELGPPEDYAISIVLAAPKVNVRRPCQTK